MAASADSVDVPLVAGTTSGARMAIVTAAACRAFRRRGTRVSPFEAQNMSSISTVCADGAEVGRAQWRTRPSTTCAARGTISASWRVREARCRSTCGLARHGFAVPPRHRRTTDGGRPGSGRGNRGQQVPWRPRRAATGARRDPRAHRPRGLRRAAPGIRTYGSTPRTRSTCLGVARRTTMRGSGNDERGSGSWCSVARVPRASPPSTHSASSPRSPPASLPTPGVDLVVLSGTRATVEDLAYMRARGRTAASRATSCAGRSSLRSPA